MKPIYYPKLSSTDFGVLRLGGPGLANCMFFAAKAFVKCQKDKGIFISPTWNKFSIGPYLRHERDKRAYTCLFRTRGLNGPAKLIVLALLKLKVLKAEKFDSLGDYFTDLIPYQKEVSDYFKSIVREETTEEINKQDVSDCIAIHVRLGDYVPEWRIPIEWYVGIVRNIIKEFPNQKFLLFSDGTDEELKLLTSMPQVKRSFFGNAFADMTAISRCKLLIASDSTFSAWGAFLGKTPIIFNRRHFPAVYGDGSIEFVLGDNTELPELAKKLF